MKIDLQTFKDNYWPKIKTQMIDSGRTLKDALGGVAPSQFYEFLKQCPELDKDFREVRAFQQMMVRQDMINAYKRSNFPNEASRLNYIRSLDIVVKSLATEIPEEEAVSYQVNVTYG